MVLIRRIASDWRCYITIGGLVLVTALVKVLPGKVRTINSLKQQPEIAVNFERGRPPTYKYDDENHPNEREHRTVEQSNWKIQNRISMFTLLAAIFAGTLSYLAFHESKVQAHAAVEANKLTVESHRAWMSGPELLDRKFVFKNVGQTPTSGLYIDMEPLSSDGDGPAAIERICKRIKGEYSRKGATFSAIPGANWLISFGDIPSAKLFPPNFPEGSWAGNQRIVGCTIYKSPPDPEMHQTGFESLLSHQNGGLSSRYSYTENAD